MYGDVASVYIWTDPPQLFSIKVSSFEDALSHKGAIVSKLVQRVMLLQPTHSL